MFRQMEMDTPAPFASMIRDNVFRQCECGTAVQTQLYGQHFESVIHVLTVNLASRHGGFGVHIGIPFHFNSNTVAADVEGDSEPFLAFEGVSGRISISPFQIRKSQLFKMICCTRSASKESRSPRTCFRLQVSYDTFAWRTTDLTTRATALQERGRGIPLQSMTLRQHEWPGRPQSHSPAS